jgi:hypothetical protein
VQREGDDEAWRSIVENFGERAELDDEPDPGPSTPAEQQSRTDAYGWAVAPEPEPDEPAELAEPTRAYGEDEDTYVPPEPPPLPVPEPDRGIAWAGVVGAPLLLLVSLLFSIGLPSWVGYLMVAWFVGGFCYLVARMPKEPRDPWDDGSRV